MPITEAQRKRILEIADRINKTSNADWFTQNYKSLYPEFNSYAGGGDTEDEYYDVLSAAGVTATLPDIKTEAGKRIAKNMASRVASGEIGMSSVPRKYQSYVEGEVKGAMPMTRYMNEEAWKVPVAALSVPAAVIGGAELAAALPVVANDIGETVAFLGTQAGKRAGIKAAVSGLSSLAGGNAVDMASSAVAPYDSFGRNLVWATGNNPEEHPIISEGAEFLNPGYGMGALIESGARGILNRGADAVSKARNRMLSRGAAAKIQPALDVQISKSDALSNLSREQSTAFDTTMDALYKGGRGEVQSSISLGAEPLPQYEIADLGGGYMLKSLRRGNPLEKQLSKQGTVNVNNIRALAGKGSKVEQAVVDKVLSSEEFAGKKAIDYNRFRKAVQDELITYERTPDTRFANYGIDELGYDGDGTDRVPNDLARTFVSENPERYRLYPLEGTDYARVRDYNAGRWIAVPDIARIMPELDLPLPHKFVTNTYTFSSPRIPNGSGKHYDSNTLGHSRTYTTTNEPYVLHVVESQSDWAQEGIKEYANVEKRAGQLQRRIENLTQDIADEEQRLGARKRIDGSVIENDWELDQLKEIIQRDRETLSGTQRELDRLYNQSQRNQEHYLVDNYPSRQIQENLRYAAEKGQKKMRYPTRETAAKIEGYPPREAYFDANGNEINSGKLYTYGDKIDAEINRIESEVTPYIELIGQWENIPPTDPLLEAEMRDSEKWWEAYCAYLKYEAERTNWGRGNVYKYESELFEKKFGRKPNTDELVSEIEEAQTKAQEALGKLFDIKRNNEPKLRDGITRKLVYNKAFEPILRRYDEFPKQYKKLFKDAEIREVTDGNGNTWYEVDVPENYLQQEWPYAEGGVLNTDYYGLGDSLLEDYRSGGRIFIKPSHKGRFTRLLQRTGKPASWFKAHGTPAQRKMATFALNSRKWKHAEGGPLLSGYNEIPSTNHANKGYTGTSEMIYGEVPDIRTNKATSGLDFSGIKTTNNRSYNRNFITYIDDYLRNNGVNDNPRAAILANIIEESGGNPFKRDSSGNFYGLLQWGEDRYAESDEKDVYREIDNQLDYLLGTLNNTTDRVSWTHGGRGSGYNSNRDALAAFNSDNFTDVMHGFTIGYVRPKGKNYSYANRLAVANQILDRYAQGKKNSEIKTISESLQERYADNISDAINLVRSIRRRLK